MLCSSLRSACTLAAFLPNIRSVEEAEREGIVLSPKIEQAMSDAGRALAAVGPSAAVPLAEYLAEDRPVPYSPLFRASDLSCRGDDGVEGRIAARAFRGADVLYRIELPSGRAVKVQFTLPVRFVLPDEDE